MKVTQKGMGLVKNHTDDLLASLRSEITGIDKVLDSLTDLDPDSMSELIGNMKFHRYFRGLNHLLRLLESVSKLLEVAEMLEDDDYSMDLEALKSECAVLLEDLTAKIR